MRLLLKIVVQPVWVEIDAEQNATELVSQPATIKPGDLTQYAAGLLEFAEQEKRAAVTEPSSQVV